MKTNDAYAVKFEKEPNGKYELEFVVKSSADLLFEFLYTSSGLSEWFCDDVNIRNGIYTFVWDGQLQQARLLKTIENQLVRFQWVDKVDGSYFEFRIQKDELTNDISLIITDFAENTQDANSSKLLWQSQVDKLLHVIGSIF
ncbi:MAG: SRPBCC domain-containing protein [Bacteroidetes bacterium]|nr:SRPBCC domain-containing protein [Bacteroidota bacterium]MCA6444859.1 SRPBCC domain-containing protein [Bacteroidota bacterium]